MKLLLDAVKFAVRAGLVVAILAYALPDFLPTVGKSCGDAMGGFVAHFFGSALKESVKAILPHWVGGN